MFRVGRKLSMARLMVELVEEIVMLLFIEVRRGVLEIKHNIKSVEKGAVMVVLGAGLLFFGLITFTGTAVAVLTIWLSTWLSALIVALGLTFFGIAFVFSGLSHFKEFTLVPNDTLHRVENIFKDYKKVSAQHHAEVQTRAREGRRDPEVQLRKPGQDRAA
ncbi:hypothetical protein GMLC_29670 [Geomonas limicola]|uniref:Phage holin family protein n=1 Tax=Geomonas limicola TaxID=2740186 RepID=A0A6V8N9Y1_9BACT|nr:phage holin family protein [Geomonas limicola]GFO69388.1 hypothetical protein GMLC_29670 [Geomonas limicola]